MPAWGTIQNPSDPRSDCRRSKQPNGLEVVELPKRLGARSAISRADDLMLRSRSQARDPTGHSYDESSLTQAGKSHVQQCRIGGGRKQLR